MVRQVSAREEFRNDAFQEDLSGKNELISIFANPTGTIVLEDFILKDTMVLISLCMSIKAREITNDTVPLPRRLCRV